MNILITGGSGFFGKNLVPALTHDYNVLAPSHQELDLLNQQALEQFVRHNHIEQIIHCATAVGKNYFEPTIMMFRSILRVSPLVDNIIYFGTGAEYGKSRDLIRVNETEFGTYVPDDPNGLSKYLTSLLSQSVSNISLLRVFGIYGPHEDYRKKFISNTIVKHLLGMPIVIKQNAVFDYLYINDLVSVTKQMLVKKAASLRVNLTPDQSISLLEIAGLMNTISGKTIPVSVLNNGMNYQYTGDNSLLKKNFPRLRFTSYVDGIKTLYQYYEAHLSEMDIESIRKDEYLQHALIKSNL